jgi:hypothetical protein
MLNGDEQFGFHRMSALVARSGTVIGDGNCTHKVEIFIALCRRRPAMPNSGSHVDLAIRSVKLPEALTGEGVVLASVANALINLPIIQRNTKNPTLYQRLALLTVVLSAIGVAVLALQECQSILRQ